MDTIVAISTSIGDGAIAIIRLSGNDALKIASKILDINLEIRKSHTINYAHVTENNNIIDEVLVSIMKSPKTYTREDVVEINTHGGIATVKKVVDLLIKEGARPALPGEFTKRAFLNGRIDLLEASAVNELLNADSEYSRDLSINKLSGKLSRLITEMKSEVENILLNINVNIDYPEYDDIYEVTINDIKTLVNELGIKLKEIINNSKEANTLKDGINIAIIGRSNVGKSSLLNKLIDEDKAIVTNIPGTTRDIVEGSMMLDGVKIKFFDTAGIRETSDVVEQIGINKSKEILDKADLILLVLDINSKLYEEDKKLLDLSKDKNRIIVINKDDLPKRLELEEEDLIYINTKDEAKINKLKDKIRDTFKIKKIVNNNLISFTTSRELSLAYEAEKFLKDLEKGVNNNYPVDALEIDLRNIYKALSEMLGEYDNIEAVNQMFERFCVGK